MQSKAIVLADKQLVGEWRYASPKSQKRLIILCHGYQSSSKNSALVAITKGLNTHGHDTFTFNFSPNAGGFDIAHQVGDIAQIVEHFKRYKEIVLLASSFGALTAAIATIQMPRITGLITLNGFFGEGSLGQEYHGDYVKFRAAALIVPRYRKIFKYFKRELRPERITVPVLVIHSKADIAVFMTQSKHFYDRLIAPRHFIKLQTANHGLTTAKDQHKVVADINEWLAKDDALSSGGYFK